MFTRQEKQKQAMVMMVLESDLSADPRCKRLSGKHTLYGGLKVRIAALSLISIVRSPYSHALHIISGKILWRERHIALTTWAGTWWAR
jgi:hypothetical protein